MKRFAITIGSALLVLIAGLATVVALKSLDAPGRNAALPRQVTPELSATKVVDGLQHPWDIVFLPDNTLIYSERNGTISTFSRGIKTVLHAPDDITATGEGGLMGLAVDPEYATNRFVYACFNTTANDIKVARWVVSSASDRLEGRKDIVVGIPASDSGRHSGCQLAFGPDKNLWIATGDAADETQPQNQSSLGGKVLRVTREGAAVEDNPVSPDKRVYSYGHRNLQALAFYDTPRDKSYGLSVEHGPDVDDEVNELEPGNFGWAPKEDYDESVPMTDVKKFPDALASVWSSGSPTIAPSGATFLKGSSWGRFEGWLAVSVLKDKQLLLLNIKNGSVSGERTFFTNEYGRLRAATQGPDGFLYLSTDNGTNDSILKIQPATK